MVKIFDARKALLLVLYGKNVKVYHRILPTIFKLADLTDLQFIGQKLKQLLTNKI